VGNIDAQGIWSYLESKVQAGIEIQLGFEIVMGAQWEPAKPSLIVRRHYVY